MGLAIAAAVVAAGATAYAASSAASSARSAQKTNVSRARSQRELEERLFHEGRGSAGHAILPEYLGNFEKEVGLDAAEGYRANMAFQGTPEEQLARYAEISRRFQPAFDQGSDVVDSIYSGAMQRERLAEAAPVMAARTQLAGTQRQGILDDITARLGALDAANARKGYVGSGSAALGAAFRQTAPLYQQAASVGALANLQNAQQTQGINDTNRDLQLSSLGLPAQRAAQAAAFNQIPVNALNQSYASAQAPFGFFRIGVGQQQASRLPDAVPIPGNGQIVASGLGQLAGAYGNYAANQALVGQIGQMSQQPAYNPYQVGQYDYSPVPRYGGGYYG